MRRRRACLLFLLFFFLGCRSQSAETAPTVTTNPEAGSVASSAPSTAIPVSSPPVPMGEEPAPVAPCSRRAFNLGLSNGRKAFAEKHYSDAVQEFTRAVAARPLDPRARGELGYAQLYAEQLEEADTNLRVGAELAAGVGDKALAAQIWFNRGLVAEKQTAHREIARACFAVSDQLNSTAATRAKLKDQSKCPIAMERMSSTSTSKDDALTIVLGWKGVHAALMDRIMGGEEGIKERARPKPATEEEAKHRSCVSYALSEKLEGNPCQSAPSWQIQTGHMMYRDFITEVIPLDGGRFALVEIVRGGGGPPSGTIHGDTALAGQRLMVMTTMGEAHFVVTRENTCVTDAMDPALSDAGGIGYGDVRSLTSTAFMIYDTKTGKPMARGIAWGEDAAKNLKLSATDLRVVVEKDSTKACDTSVLPLN